MNDKPDQTTERGATPASTRPGGSGSQRIAVAELLDGAREVILVHQGDEYRLRITSRNKLIW